MTQYRDFEIVILTENNDYLIQFAMSIVLLGMEVRGSDQCLLGESSNNYTCVLKRYCGSCVQLQTDHITYNIIANNLE